MEFDAGPIGVRNVEVAVEPGYEFLGGIDIDREKPGSDHGAVACFDELGVAVAVDPAIPREHEPDVGFHATEISVSSVRP